MTKHRGFRIQFEEGAGFYWAHGGYSDTVDEIKAEIDDFIAEDDEHNPAMFERGWDSPSLPSLPSA